MLRLLISLAHQLYPHHPLWRVSTSPFLDAWIDKLTSDPVTLAYLEDLCPKCLCNALWQSFQQFQATLN